MTDENKVVRLSTVAPMSRSFNYKHHVVHVEFNPQTKQWDWKVDHEPKTVRFDGQASTREVAEFDAKKRIDALLP